MPILPSLACTTATHNTSKHEHTRVHLMVAASVLQQVNVSLLFAGPYIKTLFTSEETRVFLPRQEQHLLNVESRLKQIQCSLFRHPTYLLIRQIWLPVNQEQKLAAIKQIGSQLVLSCVQIDSLFFAFKLAHVYFTLGNLAAW